MNDPRKILRRLYRGRDAFTVPRNAERVVDRARSSGMYGEIMPTAAMRLIDYLGLGQADSFYDLGSGAGKLVLAAAIASRAKCVGVELVEPRWRIACDALDDAQRLGVIRAREVEFRREDFMTSDLSDATVIYSCSTAFPLPFMKKLVDHLATLKKGLIFVTLQDLDPNFWFEPQDVLYLDMSWRRRSAVYVYQLMTRKRTELSSERAPRILVGRRGLRVQ
jgi:SAM-dependent methyltransferase